MIMKKFGWVLCLTVFAFLVSCGETKKQEPKNETAAEKKETPVTEEKSEKAEALEDLVYEEVGASTLKTESAARSQAELKGRVAIIRSIGNDAVQLACEFSQLRKDLFAEELDTAALAKALRDYFGKESITLKGSSVSEYSRSDKGDTTFALMEMPLMAGYEVIETAIIAVGMKMRLFRAESADGFKKDFREFFMAEKKKLLTKPS